MATSHLLPRAFNGGGSLHSVSEMPVTRPKCRFLAQTSLLQTTARTRIRPQNAHRCGQPGQQQGRRIPSLSCEHSLSTCCRLVSSFLTEMVQQIHSLRASGVMSSQAASAFASDAIAFRRSAGRLCTTPPAIRTAVIGLSHRLRDQASDTRVQLAFGDYRGHLGSGPPGPPGSNGNVTAGMAVRTKPQAPRSLPYWPPSSFEAGSPPGPAFWF